MSDQPKFIQITIGQYSNAEGVINHAVYGLSEKGNVFKFEKSKGWIQLKNPVPAVSSPKPLTRTTSHSAQIIEDDDIPF